MRSSAWILLGLAGCSGVDPALRAGELPAGEGAGGDLATIFDDAASTYDVPADLLLAVGRAETGLQPIVGAVEHEGRPRAFGVMALREDVLDEAADLAGLDPLTVRLDTSANVLAAAALLSSWADELDVDRDDLGAWAPVVARYGAIDHPDALASYVHDGVYAGLARGDVFEGGRLGKHDVVADWPLPVAAGRLGVDAAGAVWRPSPNFNGRSGSAVDFLVIHTCEGTYSGCWGWLTNASAGVSAHYVVNADGTEISQLVAESGRAWHIGATYDCANNDNVDCGYNGTSSNTISVGIEHAGYASQTSWDAGLIDASAELACGVTQRQSIPRDRYHVVAHGKLQPWNRTDPGANWPWTSYLQKIDVACGGSGGGGTPGVQPAGSWIVDSNSGANDPAKAEMVVSSNWTGSTSTSGYWNTGYWSAPTQAISDPARFRFQVGASTCLEVQAWWPAASDRAANATFLVYDPSGGEIGRKAFDQRANGSTWNTLGTWRFPAGWSSVALSRWTTAGAVVVADAVRLVPSTACAAPPAPVCGDDLIEGAEACDDGNTTSGDGCSASCAVEPLLLDAISPGRAGRTNTLTARQARPGGQVQWVVGFRTGTGSIPACPGLSIPIRNPVVVAQAIASTAGVATRGTSVPASLAGSTYRYAAVDLATCRVSAVRTVTF